MSRNIFYDICTKSDHERFNEPPQFRLPRDLCMSFTNINKVYVESVDYVNSLCHVVTKTVVNCCRAFQGRLFA